MWCGDGPAVAWRRGRRSRRVLETAEAAGSHRFGSPVIELTPEQILADGDTGSNGRLGTLTTDALDASPGGDAHGRAERN